MFNQLINENLNKESIQNTSINQTLKINEMKNFYNQIINQPIDYVAFNQANLYSKL